MSLWVYSYPNLRFNVRSRATQALYITSHFGKGYRIELTNSYTKLSCLIVTTLPSELNEHLRHGFDFHQVYSPPSLRMFCSGTATFVCKMKITVAIYCPCRLSIIQRIGLICWFPYSNTLPCNKMTLVVGNVSKIIPTIYLVT